MSSYQLAWAADEDVEDIYVYGVVNFGLRKSDSYLDTLYEAFDLIARFPNIGKLRKDILPGIRCQPVATHLIFYLAESPMVTVLRVLHSRVDVTPALFENLLP